MGKFNKRVCKMKMIEGCAFLAIWNKHLIVFSASPTHFDVKLAAEILKKS